MSEQKKQELLDKTESIALERLKQLAEMEEKYNVRIEAALDHGMLVVVPLLEYVVTISMRREEKVVTLHYNPLLKRFVVVPEFTNKEVARIHG